jgi:hypothetical protein
MMVRMCDRCTVKQGNDVAVLFNKVGADNGKAKTVLSVRQDLCETCLTKFLSAFGKFKNAWISGKISDGQETQSGGELCTTPTGKEGSGNF